MRKVIVGAFVSLDGVMQGPGGPQEDTSGGFSRGGWVFPYADEGFGKAVDELLSGEFDLLLGRKTYEIFAAHWPFVSPDDPVGQAFDKAVKFVATRNPDLKLDWTNSRSLGPDPVAEVQRLKAGSGPKLVTQGSADFLQTLFEAGLVDELHLMTFPVVLGGGKRLFGDGVAPGAWRLTSSATSESGVAIHRYVHVGELVTGSFQLDPPTEAEQARRRGL
jgi:dihydrofolate reductase